MGASSYQDEIKTDDIQAWFKDAWQNDRDYYGSNPYSGSLATLSGVRIVPDPFITEPWTEDKKQRVMDYLLDMAEKREDLLAVKANGSYIVAGWLAE